MGKKITCRTEEKCFIKHKMFEQKNWELLGMRKTAEKEGVDKVKDKQLQWYEQRESRKLNDEVT